MLVLIRNLILMVVASTLLGSVFAPRLEAGNLKIFCSTYPAYLFTKNLIQGRKKHEVKLLISGTKGCPHNYSLIPAELERLSQADILVINGLGLESFLPKVVLVAKDNLKVVDASGGADSGGIKIILNRGEVVKLNQSQKPVSNPHIFANPGTAADMVRNVSEALAILDPEGGAIYRNNAVRLVQEIMALEEDYKATGRSLGRPRIITGHNIFEYMARDLNLEIAFNLGLAGGEPPTPAELAALVSKIRKEKVRAILVAPGDDIRLAQTLGKRASIPVVVIDPVTSGPHQEVPLDYYQQVMRTNLEVVAKVLSPN